MQEKSIGYSISGISAYRDYAFGRQMIQRIGRNGRGFIPLCVLSKSYEHVERIVKNSPNTFVMIGKRVYLRYYVDSYIKTYNEEIRVRRGGRPKTGVETVLQ